MTHFLTFGSLVLGMVFFVIGQMPVPLPGDMKGWANLGAVGVFGFLFYIVLKHVFPAFIKSSKDVAVDMAERMESMDTENREERKEANKTMHEDSRNLTEVLTSMKVQCALSQEEMKNKAQSSGG